MNYTLITGASGGIGEAAAREFAAKKHNLILVARTESKLKLLCNELTTALGIKATYIVADLSDQASPKQIYEECASRKLSVNLLVNNAGIGSSGEFIQNHLKTELEIVQINCSSLTALTHLFLQDMKLRKSGCVINIGSVIALFPSPYMSVYAASKHFVKIFSYSIAQECKPYNISILFFCPGLTESNFMQTEANNNSWGKALTSNASTQSAKEVAVELINAFEKRKSFHVSGAGNRLMTKLSGLIPPRFIARVFAKQKQKEMGLIG